MTDEVDMTITRFGPEDWNPWMGKYLDDYIPRMAASCHTTQAKIKEALKTPEDEYRFEATMDGKDIHHPIKGFRMFGHDFGDWTLFTVWEDLMVKEPSFKKGKSEYAYHATVQMLNGMSKNEAAWAIYQRWLETRPKNGGSFGTGKSKSFKWKN